jgi:hypothetical protein
VRHAPDAMEPACEFELRGSSMRVEGEGVFHEHSTSIYC